MKRAVVAGVVVLLVSVAPAFARTDKPNTKKATSDREFVMDAARGSMAEVDLGKVAETKATSAEVKTFAKRMVDDHQKALDRLKTIAQSENITLPTTLNAKEQALKDRLEGLSSGAFDRAYMRAMIADHRHDVAEFKAESTHAKSADVKQYASSTLPTLEDHLKLARSTDKSVMSSSAATSAKKPASK
jgi:putative membrane protein